MRSQDYIITKDEVHGYANHWLSSALRLKYEGYKCNGSVLLQILLIAAARVVSLFAACRDLADAPSDQTVRDALRTTLPEIAELERRLNLALVTNVPKALRRKPRVIAIDLTLIPYHGQPAVDPKEIYRSKPKSGTTHFHAYATAVVVHQGYRYTLALCGCGFTFDSPKRSIVRSRNCSWSCSVSRNSYSGLHKWCSVS
jgi:putative transposase